MRIREEKQADYKDIYNVISMAFRNAEHADGNEQDLVVELRKGKAYIPELSLVAEIDGKIVGHIMFTKMYIGDNIALALAPLSVLPDYQNQKIGSELIIEGHKRAVGLGYAYSVVLGSDLFYPRFGLSAGKKLWNRNTKWNTGEVLYGVSFDGERKTRLGKSEICG